MLFEKPRHPTQDERFLQLEPATTDDTEHMSSATWPMAIISWRWQRIPGMRGDAKSGCELARQRGERCRSPTRCGLPITYFDSTTDEASAMAISLAKGSREEANINLHAVPALQFLVQPPRDQQDQNQFRQSCSGNRFSAFKCPRT